MVLTFVMRNWQVSNFSPYARYRGENWPSSRSVSGMARCEYGSMAASSFTNEVLSFPAACAKVLGSAVMLAPISMRNLTVVSPPPNIALKTYPVRSGGNEMSARDYIKLYY